MRKCLGENCHNYVTNRFALCRECEEIYGKSPRTWPEWLRFLWNDMQREQRRERMIRRKEIPISYDG